MPGRGTRVQRDRMHGRRGTDAARCTLEATEARGDPLNDRTQPPDRTQRSAAVFRASTPTPPERRPEGTAITSDTGPTPTIDLLTGEAVSAGMSPGASTGGSAGGVVTGEVSGDAAFPDDQVARAPDDAGDAPGG